MVKGRWGTVPIGLFFLSLAIITSTIPDGFEHIGDMGTSGTGVAISRTYYDKELNQLASLPGYIFDGEYNVYANWPPFGFKVLAAWFHLLGEDSIYNARLLPSLLYALSAVLVFILLLRCKLDWEIALISAVLFSVLPYHLEFGKLIFSDMWLMPFWLFCFLIYSGRPKYHWLIIPLSLIGFLGFMWFAIFVIPAFIFIKLIKRYKLEFWQIAFCIVGIALFAFISQLTLSSLSQNGTHPLLVALKRWTVFGWQSDERLLYRLFRRPLSLLYEGFPVLILLIILLKKMGVQQLKIQKSENLIRVTLFIGLTLFFYVVFLPNWFVTHTYGVGFFGVLIVFFAAFLLQMTKETFGKKVSSIGGVLMIFCSLGMYFGYRLLSEGYENEPEKVKEIISYVDSENEYIHPTIFFDLCSKENIFEWPHAFQIGIKEKARSYVFSSDSVMNFSTLENYFHGGFNKLRSLGRYDFDSLETYLVTVRTKRNVADLNILDTLQLGSLNVYRISLSY